MRANLTLPTSVEESISGWIRIQEGLRAKAPGKVKRYPTVTISRQYGCEGFPLSLCLQALFEQATGEKWGILDKDLIEKVAQDEHISLRVLQHLEDPSRYLEDYGFHPRGETTGDEAFAKMAVSLIHFARSGNAIIVGRGGAILCRKLDNCFHFRLEAGLDWRLSSLAKRMGITLKEAAEQEHHQSKLREHYIRDKFSVDVADRSFYDAVFNNERHSIDEIAAAILAYVRCGWERGEGLTKPSCHP